mgnify:CR=1 FL=1
MPRRTKIVATLGPATEDKAVIRELLNAGLNVARLNFSHGTYKQFKKIAANIRKVEKESSEIITIMQDLQGPKIRLSPEQKETEVKKGDIITFSTKAGQKDCIFVPNCNMLSKIVKAGDRLLIEDGLIRTKILSKRGHKIKAKVIAGGILKACKGINIPDSKLPGSASLTPKDRKDLEFGVKKLKVDAIAVSFVETAEDIIRVRKEIAKHTKKPIMIVAKIEREEALRNLEQIIDTADGVMVARGDLGIETKAETVPLTQKRIIKLARRHGKPVIIATQMLQSMVEDPLPTRAEVSDAANAIFEHADAVMLSNESAVGKYPVRAVETLAKIASTIEKSIFKETDLFPSPAFDQLDDIVDESMALNACRVADEINASAIVIMTAEGFTARTVLKHRPKTQAIIVTSNAKIAGQLNFLWGADEIIVRKEKLRSEETKNLLLKHCYLNKGEDVVLIKLSDKKRSLVVMKV